MPVRATGSHARAPADRAQIERVLARFAAFPRRVDEELHWLRQGIERGRVPPRAVLERVLANFDAQLATAVDDGACFEPFERLGGGIAADEGQGLRDFVAGPYLAAAPASGAMRDYPDGARLYDALIAERTTLPLTAAQIHAMGLREVERLRGEVERTMRDAGFDGSRAGWFNANVPGYKRRPTWGMETLTAHEAVPGHHLQIARAAELRDLPAFRRDAGYTAYIEGWALYAETLGFDLGLYQDPYSRFGHQQWQLFRAARLVVDTGIHALGWSRQQAIDYVVDTAGEDRDLVEAEVDRYISWPGQALAYTTGKLKIDELRDRARAALGERFDIRRFHNVVLDQGAVPLPELERLVDDWIARAQPRAAR